MTALTSLTVRGMRWTYLAGAASIAVQMPYSAVMARLLTPADFGLMALAALVLRFAEHFAECGLSSAVVQRTTLTRRDVRVVFTLALFTGTCGFTAVWFIAPYGTQLLHAPAELTALSRTLALSLLITALGATAEGLLSRRMRYRTVALTDFLSYAVGYCGIGLTSALLGGGVWSLVYAALGRSLVASLLNYLLVRHPLRPLFDVQAMREITRFGAKVSVNEFLEFLTANLGSFTIGRYAGVTAAGLYNRAALLTALPLQHIQGAASKVLYPAFSRIQHESGRLGATYADCTALTTLIFFPLSAVIGASSQQLVAVVLGGQWRGCSELVPILGLVSALSLVAHFPGKLVEATGAAGGNAVIHLVQLAVLVAGVGVTLFLRSGVDGLMMAVLVSELTKQALYCSWLNRLFPATRRPVAEAYAQAAAFSAVIWGALRAIQPALDGGCPPVLVLAVQLTVASALILCCLRYATGLHGVRVARERGLLPLKLMRRSRKNA